MGWIAALYFMSGAAALIVETVWLRWFRLLLGATAPAASATLAGFFAGHALGAWLGSRWAPRWRRPLLAYAGLELLAAGGALLVPLVVAAGEVATASSYDALRESPAALTALRFGLALVATLPAAVGFGATFPTIGAAVVRRAEAMGSRGAGLYGLNTLGAALGSGLASFVLLDAIGVRATYAVGIGLTLVASAGAAWLWRRGTVAEDAPAPERRSQVRASGPMGGSALLIFAALSGFCALATQVLLVHAFAQVMNQSSYAFGGVLVTVLTTLALGAGLMAWIDGRGLLDPHSVLGAAFAAAAVGLAAFPALLYAVSDGLRALHSEAPWPGYLFVLLRLAVVTAGPALLAAALVLPATFALAGRRAQGHPGALLGRLSAANTLGAICGALAAPFVLMPLFGVWLSFGVLAALLALAALCVDESFSRRVVRDVSLVSALTVIGVVFAPWSIPPMYLSPGERVVTSRTSASGVTAVVENLDGSMIRTDNHYTLGGTRARVQEERQGHLPLLLHPSAESVAFVGTASGITAGAAVPHPVERIYLVELVPNVARLAGDYFGFANRNVYADPRAVVVLDDARNFFRNTRERFDVVVADLFVPWRAGAGSLYTEAHFAAVRERLQPDGLFCQWLALYQLSPREFEIIAHTFLRVFPEAAVFRADFFGSYPVAALVGWNGRPADPTAVSEAARRLGAAGETDRWVTDPIGPWTLYVGPLAPFGETIQQRPLNTDDRPAIEFLAARTQQGGRQGKQNALVGMNWVALSDRIRSAAGGRDTIYPDLSSEAREASSGGLALQAASALYIAGQPQKSARMFTVGAERIPARLVSEASADASVANVWHTLEPKR